MARPPWEVADVIRRGGGRFLDGYRSSLTYPQVKVFNAIARCRTAALGGHRDQCERCHHQTISYNSRRNRHCPKCQANARDKVASSSTTGAFARHLLSRGLQRATSAHTADVAEQAIAVCASV